MLKYIKLNKDNLKIAVDIQAKIWPDFPDASHFIESLKLKDKNFEYYIVQDKNGVPLGITGHYPELDGNSTIWLGWYGILESFRGKGYGKQILLDTIEMCKKLDFPFFRAYTTETYDASAQPLYKKVMQLCERYENEHDETYENSTLVYSYALKNLPLTKWNNKYIGIKEYDELAETVKEF